MGMGKMGGMRMGKMGAEMDDLGAFIAFTGLWLSALDLSTRNGTYPSQEMKRLASTLIGETVDARERALLTAARAFAVFLDDLELGGGQPARETLKEFALSLARRAES